jgi:hypothetical protein
MALLVAYVVLAQWAKRRFHQVVIQQLHRGVNRKAPEPTIPQVVIKLASPTGFEPVLPP